MKAKSEMRSIEIKIVKEYLLGILAEVSSDIKAEIERGDNNLYIDWWVKDPRLFNQLDFSIDYMEILCGGKHGCFNIEIADPDLTNKIKSYIRKCLHE